MMTKGQWVFTFDAPVNSRIFSRGFIGVTHFATAHLWWNPYRRVWETPESMLGNEVCTSTAQCNSFKAFKRHLRKHPKLKELDEVILISRFIGYDIRARWVEE